MDAPLSQRPPELIEHSRDVARPVGSNPRPVNTGGQLPAVVIGRCHASTVRVDDLFVDRRDVQAIEDDPFGNPPMLRCLNEPMMADLRRAPLDGRTDVEVAVPLAQLVQDELTAYGTDGRTTVGESEIAATIQALRAITRRLDVVFDPPYRNYSTFRTHWIEHDCSGSWQARRELVAKLFDPLYAKLLALEDASFETLADPVSPRAATGWPVVDTEIRELRRHFQRASTAQDYRDVGNRAVALTEALGDAVYEPGQHLHPGEQPIGRGNTKLRFDRYIEHVAPGAHNAAARKLARSVVEFAQSTKHRSEPTRRDAGLAADSAIMLANVLRRFAQEL